MYGKGGREIERETKKGERESFDVLECLYSPSPIVVLVNAKHYFLSVCVLNCP